ncbi:hypothetical protein V1227_00050 [Lentzea sp. DG1S-22]|uniref:hypothetical protein n=1 Tax=Lentzea sp. DG1S-22 TaxID=3108822 RepID=UPI002E76AB0D|nr:hypothetical protein [Lentzea sp. DG1S-22]WVH81183.1 hypothetical protein V1227_00050 [Lentzea sp. DG1S-22]
MVREDDLRATFSALHQDAEAPPRAVTAADLIRRGQAVRSRRRTVAVVGTGLATAGVVAVALAVLPAAKPSEPATPPLPSTTSAPPTPSPVSPTPAPGSVGATPTTVRSPDPTGPPRSTRVPDPPSSPQAPPMSNPQTSVPPANSSGLLSTRPSPTG